MSQSEDSESRSTWAGAVRWPHRESEGYVSEQFLTITADDSQEAKNLLERHGLEVAALEQKGAIEVQMILVAIGGGTGVAAILHSLGRVVEAYFAGRSDLESRRSITFAKGQTRITIRGGNFVPALQELALLLSPPEGPQHVPTHAQGPKRRSRKL